MEDKMLELQTFDSRLIYKIGMVGSPSTPHLAWSDEHLRKLKSFGFNTLQLNIAWGSRPSDEPLNLEDVILISDVTEQDCIRIKKRQERIKARISKCKHYGFRSIFHFGAPFNGRIGYQQDEIPNCLLDARTPQHCASLLCQFREQVPGVDDILLYVYDQDAWLCNEFNGCPRCYGVPLHERLPGFLRLITDVWSEGNPDGRVWWEPWELSAGQILKILPQLPRKQFGLVLHSNIAEVQITYPVDLWFKNTVIIARNLGIPVVGEFFLSTSTEETQPLKHMPCPRLVYEGIHSMVSLDGVQGIKEYYGLGLDSIDPNLEMVGAIFREPTLGLEEQLIRISKPYGLAAKVVLEMWEYAARGMEIYPWDASWYAREVGRSNIDHGWFMAFIRGQQAHTPSWCSSRRAHFMKTDNLQPDPWLLEDVQLRCSLAAEQFKLAQVAAEHAITLTGESYRDALKATMQDLLTFFKVCKAYELHIRESLLAYMIRKILACGDEVPQRFWQELGKLLDEDVNNQDNATQVREIRDRYVSDPIGWLKKYLTTTEENLVERGDFSMTSR